MNGQKYILYSVLFGMRKKSYHLWQPWWHYISEIYKSGIDKYHMIITDIWNRKSQIMKRKSSIVVIRALRVGEFGEMFKGHKLVVRTWFELRHSTIFSQQYIIIYFKIAKRQCSPHEKEIIMWGDRVLS